MLCNDLIRVATLARNRKSCTGVAATKTSEREIVKRASDGGRRRRNGGNEGGVEMKTMTILVTINRRAPPRGDFRPFGSHEQIFGVNEQISGRGLSD
jgi:hypothetical protein